MYWLGVSQGRVSYLKLLSSSYCRHQQQIACLSSTLYQKDLLLTDYCNTVMSPAYALPSLIMQVPHRIPVEDDLTVPVQVVTSHCLSRPVQVYWQDRRKDMLCERQTLRVNMQ